MIWAGAGGDTLTGGGGSNVFEFVQSNAVGADIITDFNANDTVNIFGYGADAASVAIANATVSSNSTNIQLSDSTSITFLNVTSLSGLNIHSS